MSYKKLYWKAVNDKVSYCKVTKGVENLFNGINHQEIVTVLNNRNKEYLYELELLNVCPITESNIAYHNYIKRTFVGKVKQYNLRKLQTYISLFDNKNSLFNVGDLIIHKLSTISVFGEVITEDRYYVVIAETDNHIYLRYNANENLSTIQPYDTFIITYYKKHTDKTKYKFTYHRLNNNLISNVIYDENYISPLYNELKDLSADELETFITSNKLNLIKTSIAVTNNAFIY